MYEITITTVPNANDVKMIDAGYEHVCAHWDLVADWFTECINQNLILNLCVVDPTGEEWPDITMYYAVDAESAQQFVDAWTDLDAEFSMGKLWNMINFSQTISIKEIDFEQVWAETIVNEDKSELWSVWRKPV